MASMRNQIDTYLQDMLKAQYKVSSPIEHKPTKGKLREEFIKNVVHKEFPNLFLKDGILTAGDWQSTQGDFLWLKDNARVGGLNIYDIDDCKMFMEIKSYATAGELREINATAKILKDRHSEEFPITVGMFCYSTEATAKTVLKKFGFAYEKDIDAYNGYQADIDEMSNVDFLYSLNICNDEKSFPYLVARDVTGICTLYQDNPVIKYFLNYFK